MLVEKKKKPIPEIPQASLPDIAFLLIVFFIVATTMDTDRGIPMVLPERGGEMKINPQNIAKILVNSNGDFLMDGKQVDEPGLRDALQIRLKERGNDAEGNPKLIVSIKTDRETPYERYIDVLDVVKGVGTTKISIAEPDKE